MRLLTYERKYNDLPSGEMNYEGNAAGLSGNYFGGVLSTISSPPEA